MSEIIHKIRSEGVVLYGAGRIGQQIAGKYMESGIKILAVWDQRAKALEIENAMEVTLPDYTYRKDVVIVVCVHSRKIYEDIRETLLAHGFSHVLKSNDDALGQFGVCDGLQRQDIRRCNCCVVTGGGCPAYLAILKQGHESHVDMPLLALTPTYRCTLKCKNCVQMTGEFRKKGIDWQFDLKVFREIWGKFIAAVGWVDVLTFTGGEFFNYTHWKELLAFCVAEQAVGVINITTNGIHHFQREDIEQIKKDKIVITLDDYGERLSEWQNDIFRETEGLFAQYGINYYVLHNEEGIWYEHGDHHERGYSEQRLKNMYRECPFSECYAIQTDMTFTICGRQNILRKLEGMDLFDKDYVSIGDYEDVGELRAAIQTLMRRDYLDVCGFCTGNAKSVPAAEQSES
ncbi:MAG: hypothetical protein NC331_09750 [Lachnospiraceae bacterium]|nr:hypothetical protein [Lachnospiraceae bacterium]MCM1239655.1 hypothetical protein [Lachnospiraceae bacterium]